jgi:hypothetical protein
MSYIGNTNTTQAFTPAIDYFSGNASTTAFTLSRPVASVAQVQAVVNNVAQNPSDAFTVSGNTITFTSAPSSGTNNIYVYYTSPITQVIAPGQGTVGTASLSSSLLVPPSAISDQLNSSTGYFDLPAGTTAQRPGSPVVGMIRYNTTESKYEAYSGTQWQFITVTSYNYNAAYLMVAGGGGGGVGHGGGGGAGGLLSGTASLVGGTTYTITVGAGGVGAVNGVSLPANGTNSTFYSLTAIGGGYGGGENQPGNATINGNSGGSGGGGANSTLGTGNGGAGTSGQGFAGGSGSGGNGWAAGGGGGASAVGANNPTTQTGGAGGAGSASSITGSSVTYGGGGGGGGGSTAGGAGGAGGGGGGSILSGPAGTAGTANLGGGGGGSRNTGGGAGGSGVIILSVPTANYKGITTGSPTVTTSGSNTILTFTGSGSYTA